MKNKKLIASEGKVLSILINALADHGVYMEKIVDCWLQHNVCDEDRVKTLEALKSAINECGIESEYEIEEDSEGPSQYDH